MQRVVITSRLAHRRVSSISSISSVPSVPSCLLCLLCLLSPPLSPPLLLCLFCHSSGPGDSDQLVNIHPVVRHKWQQCSWGCQGRVLELWCHTYTALAVWHRGLNDELNCNACGLYCKLVCARSQMSSVYSPNASPSIHNRIRK